MAQIRGISIHFPNKTVTNDDLKREFPDADFNSFEETVGVKSRHVAAKGETALDLAEKAASKLINNHGVDNIDFILFCTQTSDYPVPGNASLLQNRLGLPKHVGAFDINLGCSGYVYGLAAAKGFVDTGMARSVLLIASDTFSGYVHPKDRINRALIGDGATATLIDNSADGIKNFEFGTDGSGYEHLIVKNGGFRSSYNPKAEEFEYGTSNITDDNHFYMNGLEVFSFTARVVPKLVKDTLEKNALDINQIDHFIFHQANAYMLNFLKKKLKIDDSKFYINLDQVGNTSGATIPIALHELLNNNTIKNGDKLLLAGYGIGLSWAGVVVEV